MLCLNLFEGRSLAISDLQKRLRPSKIKMKLAVLGLLREFADTKKEEVKLPLISIGCAKG